MQLTTHRLNLPLKHPFTIARGTITSQPTLIVCLEHDGVCGFGEVTENTYYGHSFASMSRSLQKVHDLLPRYAESSPEEVWPDLLDRIPEDRFALSALDMAAHDWYGKRLGKTTRAVWGLKDQSIPQSSFTIGIDEVGKMVEKLREAAGWGIYKIKLGTRHDLEIVAALRRETSARFRVDANCGWEVEETIENSKALRELGVEFIEQPLPPQATIEQKREVFSQSVLPIIADEDCQIERDVALCHGLYHGINVKVCKCGGLTPALAMLRQARSLKMQTMIGCMVESSIGISAAAQLAALLDYADLDGAELLSRDPAQGVHIDHGTIQWSPLAGCGGTLKTATLTSFYSEPLRNGV